MEDMNVWVFYFPELEGVIDVLTLVLFAMIVILFVVSLRNERRRAKLMRECEAFLREPKEESA